MNSLQYTDNNNMNDKIQINRELHHHHHQQQQHQQYTDNNYDNKLQTNNKGSLFVEENNNNNLKRRSITSSISPNRLNYNFNNYPTSFNKNRLFSSDATSSTTTESDILSPPSSPQYNYNNNNMRNQQPQQLKIHYPIPIVDHSNSSTSSPSMSKSIAAANIASAIVRQHSYLNAVRMNEEYLYRQQLKQQQQPILTKQQSFTYNDNNESNSSLTPANNQSPLIQYQHNNNNNHNKTYYNSYNDDYDVLQQQQQQHDVTKYIDSDNNSTPINLLKYQQKHRLKLRTPQSSSSSSTAATGINNKNNNNDDDTRRHSYIKATNLYNNQQDDNLLFSKPPQQPSSNLLQNSNQSSKKEKQLNTPPQSSRNTSIKKLKNFFGEKTPVVLQAFETKNIIASDVFLNTILETVKEGVLNCKILSKDGKRSTDRSWKPAWAVLKKSGALFLCKEKKDNIMIPSVDSYPINLKNSTIFIPTDYTKRKNVFKVTTCSNSEYLFQTVDHESMLEWIQAMQENSNTDKIIISTSSASSMSLEQQKLRRISFESNTLNPSTSNNLISNNRLSLYEAKKLTNQQTNDYDQHLMNNHRLSENGGGGDSPTHRKEETSPRRDNNNRKWVRSMTRRIRDFMNSANNVDASSNEFNTSTNSNDFSNKNFGVPLNKCEPSSLSCYVPAVVEICTRLIELHLTDEGIYRKVGQKLVVNSLRSQMNKGIKYVDISDFNWDNPHAIVSLLKSFLNELPDSLITTNLYNDFIQVCRVENHHIRLISIKKLLKQLPINNYETLKYLSLHLRRVASAYQHNKMTVKNICIAFSQSIVRHNDANCETIKTDHLQQSLLIEIILTYHDWLFNEQQQQQMESVNIPNEIKDIELHLLQQYCSFIEPTSTSDLLLNIIKSIRNKWHLNDQFNSFDNGQQQQPQQPINIQFRSSKSVGAIVRNNTRSKDRSRSADVRIKSTTRSVPLLSALTLKSALHSGDDNHKSKNSTKSKTNLKMKKKNKQSKRQLLQENNESDKPTSPNPVATAIFETKSINSDNNDDEKALNETIAKEYNNFKTLEKRNQEEREKLNELMKKLNDELITAQIDIMKEDYIVNNKNDLQATLQYRKQILEAASTTSTNSSSSLNNRIIQQQHNLNNKLKQQKELKKNKSQRRRHTISSTRDHLPLNDLKSKQDDQLEKKINDNEMIITKATPLIINNNVKKPKIIILNQNSNTVIKPSTKFKSLSNIHNQPSELSSISSYSSSIVPSTSSSSASTTSTTSSKCVYNNNLIDNDQQNQQEQKSCNLFKDSIRQNNNLVDQFESLI